MNERSTQLAAILAVGFASVGVAHADHYGTVEAAHACEKEVAAAAGGSAYKWIDEAMKTGKGLSAECKAELDKRLPACLKDPFMKRELTDPELNKGNPNGVCYAKTFADLSSQLADEKQDKEQEAEKAKKQQEAKAKQAADVAATELPKAEKRDPKLEKAVADAYKKDYPEGTKVLKVILGTWSSDLEKDDFGRVIGRDLDATVVMKDDAGRCWLHSELFMQKGNGKSFSGPLAARGAGSASDKEILCSKADAAAGKKK